MLKLTIAAMTAGLAFNLLIVKSEAQGQYPFVGKWDCEVSVFEFTDKRYSNGSNWIEYKSVRRMSNGFLIEFKDGYRIGLFDVKTNTMTWSSASSGDDFQCKRLKI